MYDLLEQEISETEKYLKSGNQTLITPEIQKIADDFHGETLEKVEQIFNKIRSFGLKKFDDKVFRKRTAARIIEEGYLTGCTDFALTFIALARASGIPAKYIETIDGEWLKEGGESYQGHIYSQIYDRKKEKWIWVDPMGGEIGATPAEANRIIYKEGLDSWDIGITDFESLKRNFLNFRETVKSDRLKEGS